MLGRPRNIHASSKGLRPAKERGHRTAVMRAAMIGGCHGAVAKQGVMSPPSTATMTRTKQVVDSKVTTKNVGHEGI